VRFIKLIFRRKWIQNFVYNVWEGFLAMSFISRASFPAVHLAHCHHAFFWEGFLLESVTITVSTKSTRVSFGDTVHAEFIFEKEAH
jgi:hypothetical protein